MTNICSVHNLLPRTRRRRDESWETRSVSLVPSKTKKKFEILELFCIGIFQERLSRFLYFTIGPFIFQSFLIVFPLKFKAGKNQAKLLNKQSFSKSYGSLQVNIGRTPVSLLVCGSVLLIHPQMYLISFVSNPLLPISSPSGVIL
jgi:hypothetical protein